MLRDGGGEDLLQFNPKSFSSDQALSSERDLQHTSLVSLHKKNPCPGDPPLFSNTKMSHRFIGVLIDKQEGPIA